MNSDNIRPEWIPSAYAKKGEKLSLNTSKDLLFGVAVGDDSILQHWLSPLDRKDDIEDLSVRMFKAVQ
jgi:hypothetical protein